ncbi:hypothetical protein Psal006b_03570 (plasmid) [Piscirickettsia salmonis]|uniref:TnsA endonuclease C n=1 Tax=Piscirickettsia salmonis TaxID=1238 RepID=A0A7H0Z8Y5_PISSA|nr:hypothetical protein [Piscirickettsia salmonis]ALB24396.1 tnsA endonuclease C [Piscirickettsia salmonis]AMA44054.1 hypothetical protein AWJ11_16880 [Piscirickettsia salmonis]AOS36840.1 hypothetical protein AVM72_15800 [Piscirickettsia salmonis]APS65541.1 hypothetical protein AVI54_17190 [Piscirickettsia salmonis]APS68758.1 hypothetical protein AVI55_16950 [Piscirickettsia salmonis]
MDRIERFEETKQLCMSRNHDHRYGVTWENININRLLSGGLISNKLNYDNGVITLFEKLCLKKIPVNKCAAQPAFIKFLREEPNLLKINYYLSKERLHQKGVDLLQELVKDIEEITKHFYLRLGHAGAKYNHEMEQAITKSQPLRVDSYYSIWNKEINRYGYHKQGLVINGIGWSVTTLSHHNTSSIYELSFFEIKEMRDLALSEYEIKQVYPGTSIIEVFIRKRSNKGHLIFIDIDKMERVKKKEAQLRIFQQLDSGHAKAS